MFERYPEVSRRAIFFARYEASRYGGRRIDTEHLLLGLLRESPIEIDALKNGEWFRAEIEKRITIHEPIPASVEIPLSEDCKRALNFAKQEADASKSHFIGPQHLFLGLFRVEDSTAAQLLRARGLDMETLRKECAAEAASESGTLAKDGEPVFTIHRRADDAVSAAHRALENFLEGLKEARPALFAIFFNDRSQFMDLQGRRWAGPQIGEHAAEILRLYSTTRASYRVETQRLNSRVLIATVLWDIASTVGESKARQRMTVVMVHESGDWIVSTVQVSPAAEP